MKASRSLKAKQLASSLLVALVLTTVLSLSILGYLTVVEQQNLLGARSQVWNMSIAVVEAGIEEALQQLNANPKNLGADGWSFDGTSYTRSRTMPDGNSYDAKINTSDPSNPVITCRANVIPPAFVRNSLPLCFATEGVTTPTRAPVRRAVMVRTSRGNLFTAALVAKRSIDMNGNGVYTDSYDSTDSAKSTAGKYDSAKYSGNHGDIATNGGVTNSVIVSVGNANIYGIIHTGPQCPVAFLPQGGVGPHGAQVNDITTAKNLGYVLEDANFTFPDTTLPADYASYLTPSAGSIITWSNNITSRSTNSMAAPSYSPWGGTVTNNYPSYTSTYPTPVPPGLTTNVAYNTVSTYPTQPQPGLTTNANNITGSSTLPSPRPANLTTNYLTSPTTTDSYPIPGTYVGTVTTNYNGNSGNIKNYTYNKITGYTYNYTVYTYTYPVYTYVIPHYTYTYSLYATNTLYFTNTYNYVLMGDRKYVASSLSGSICVAGPNVTLVMPNGLSGAESFTFNQGANVLVYSGGSSVTINGNQYLNPNFNPASFIVFCTPSVTTFTLNGNGQFTGVLVAPNANIKMNGGGNSNVDFCGSLMVNSCTMNGHYSFHYDESLSHQPSNGRFLISGWDEIDPATF
jgi:hypothetical protein